MEKDQQNTKSQPEPEATATSIDESTPTPVLTNVEKDDVVTTGVSVTEEPVTVVMKAPKKAKRHGFIVAVVLLFLFFVGGSCLAFWHFGVRNSPENIAYDAFRQLLTAENIAFDGSVQFLEIPSYDQNPAIRATLTFGAANSYLPNETTAVLTISEVDSAGKIVDNHSLDVAVFTQLTAKGELYFKIDSAANSFREYLEDVGSTFGEITLDILDALYGEWWYVSVSELAQAYDEEEGDAIAELYECAIAAINHASSQEFLNIYSNNQFATIQRTDRAASAGNTIYQLELQPAALAGFINALPESELANQIYTCYNTAAAKLDPSSATASAADFDEVSAEDLEAALPEDLELYLEIANDSHQLVRIQGSQTSEFPNLNTELTFTVGLQYVPASTVAAPDEYRPISDLMEEIIEIVTDYFYADEEEYEYEYDWVEHSTPRSEVQEESA